MTVTARKNFAARNAGERFAHRSCLGIGALLLLAFFAASASISLHQSNPSRTTIVDDSPGRGTLWMESQMGKVKKIGRNGRPDHRWNLGYVWSAWLKGRASMLGYITQNQLAHAIGIGLPELQTLLTFIQPPAPALAIAGRIAAALMTTPQMICDGYANMHWTRPPIKVATKRGDDARDVLHSAKAAIGRLGSADLFVLRQLLASSVIGSLKGRYDRPGKRK